MLHKQYKPSLRFPDARVVTRLLAQPAGSLYASELTRFELRRSAFLRDDPEPLWSRIREFILPLVHWLPLDQAISLRAGELSARLRLQGREIGVVDTLLAATAQARGRRYSTAGRVRFRCVRSLNAAATAPGDGGL
ncbi:MAG: type II toxin-antitoxin system VapC family toxin [Xanthomonadaceae bacterium]|nr:type II toxin-antitoxin system VapC family toxin [Xanthomonadaceae bacterium]